MSFIRTLEKPKWEDGIGDGLYVYGDQTHIVGLPKRYRPFVEVVMRMLEQSDELDEETLEVIHGALRDRLDIEEGSVGRND
jgi:hypothetical protein